MLNIVEPALGGVLIMGDRGTGKSLAVRALAAIVPNIDVVIGDNYNSSPTNIRLMGPEAEKSLRAGEAFDVKQIQIPLVELPLGATEDRVCGTIDIERALTEGVKAYEPGLLAKANQGILYVDEVNLLEDGLVDVVLDSAASGWNTVEREGVSIGHPASFILVGSGTQSQGELRPQLLDRFGLSVKANTITDADERVDMVVRRTAYEKDPKKFVAECGAEGEELTAKLTAARKLMPKTSIDRELSLKISEICSMLNVDGLRGDIVTNRAARAHAALEGRTEATQADIERVIVACLAHRLRKDVMDSLDGNEYKVVIAYRKVFGGFVGAPPAAAEAAPEPEPEEEEKPKEKKAGAWDPSSLGRR
ncbi:Bifunctional NAD(P)H-hydrate repair enzyme [Cymbomonas tetramitiformis]|uniref:magnesium chelatase n=1 Tax=Cymbomonas tetramitiformis TaxID=36881 RepID=A0AAE0F5I7_9CHLO|nr:Bifunctional NAD(P)H-hydrate repair enzyme [Cymbomonas tetramitiformis]